MVLAFILDIVFFLLSQRIERNVFLRRVAKERREVRFHMVKVYTIDVMTTLETECVDCLGPWLSAARFDCAPLLWNGISRLLMSHTHGSLSTRCSEICIWRTSRDMSFCLSATLQRDLSVLALRPSAVLMNGIVKVYSRQVAFLLGEKDWTALGLGQVESYFSFFVCTWTSWRSEFPWEVAFYIHANKHWSTMAWERCFVCQQFVVFTLRVMYCVFPDDSSTVQKSHFLLLRMIQNPTLKHMSCCPMRSEL